MVKGFDVKKEIVEIIKKLENEGKSKDEIKKEIIELLAFEYNRTPEKRIQRIVNDTVDEYFSKKNIREKIKEKGDAKRGRLTGGRLPNEYVDEKRAYEMFARGMKSYRERIQKEQMTREDYNHYRRLIEQAYANGSIDRKRAKKEAKELYHLYEKSLESGLKEHASREKQIHKAIQFAEGQKTPWEREDKEFMDKGPKEQEDERAKWYKEEKDKLKHRKQVLDQIFKNGEVSAEEYQREIADLENQRGELRRRAYGDIGFKRSMRFFGRGLSHAGRFTQGKYGAHLLQVVQLLALSIIGVVVTATTGSWLFFMGFLSIALFFLVPDPKDYEPKKGQKLSMMSWLPIGPESRSQHNGYAFLRSLAKVSAVLFFAYAFKDLGDVFNIFFIGISIFGYFLLKVEYDPDVPAEFIESVFRFFIGIFFIPTIFVSIFDSWVLGAIALAFFAVPPLPAAENKNLASVLSRGLSGATAYYEIADKFVFAGLMLFALVGAGVLDFVGLGGVGWELTGAMQNTFLYFWIVTAVAGFFSPAKERPVTGAIMLGAATIIYGIGPGSQAVGSGLLGDWWPTVHNSFTAATEPLANVMGSLGNTFSQGFLLLTNPVGYATQLMNGSYADNPTGQTGSFGVDINSMTISPILPTQPFIVSAIIENKGSFEARNLQMSIQALSGDKFGTEGKSRTTDYLNLDFIRETSKFNLGHLGFTSDCNEGAWGAVEIKECTNSYEGVFGKRMVWQNSFRSTGIPCSSITGFDLRKKYIPFFVKTTYDYQSDSRVQVEFISQAEWDRKAQAGELDRGFDFVESQYSSAPVIFPIGTAGLKNPILASSPFHISMSLASAFKTGSQISEVKNVTLNYPPEWTIKEPCTPGGTVDKAAGTVTWTNLGSGSKTFACYFEPLGDKVSSPTKTYIVTAHADYSFSRWTEKDALIEFGGFCCPDRIDENGCKISSSGTSFWEQLNTMTADQCTSEDCLDSQKCINNACVYHQDPGSEIPGSETNGETTPPEGIEGSTSFGGSKYCENKMKPPSEGGAGTKCTWGDGGCDLNTDQCFYPEGFHPSYGTLSCRATGIGVNLCCFNGEPEQNCIDKFRSLGGGVRKL